MEFPKKFNHNLTTEDTEVTEVTEVSYIFKIELRVIYDDLDKEPVLLGLK